MYCQMLQSSSRSCTYFGEHGTKLSTQTPFAAVHCYHPLHLFVQVYTLYV